VALPIDKFIFEGFLPAKKGRKSRLEKLALESRTMVFYESPHKLLRTLLDFDNFFGSNRKISISRELTKLYEETLRGSIKEMVAIYSNKKPKGEYVIIVQGKGK
jgi:16S rRNA (cytidine1402-2'-O)-methyltransferase